MGVPLLAVAAGVAVAMLALCAINHSDDSSAGVTASGKTGDCTWTLTDDGVFTVSGHGAMENYWDNWNIPWYGAYIKAVVISDGVTNVGNTAFQDCVYLTYVGSTPIIVGKLYRSTNIVES